MDLSKFKTSDWLKVGGGALFLIAGFLKWWGPPGDACDGVGNEFGERSFCESAVDEFSRNGWDFFLTGIVPWILLVAIAVLTVLAVQGIFKLPSSIPAPLVFLAAAALSVLLVVIRFFDNGLPEVFGADDDISRKLGLFLALIAAIVVLVGCVLGFKESGGDLNDLTDMNKIKGAFNQGGGSTPPPPPPPPGMPPPPPPPAL